MTMSPTRLYVPPRTRLETVWRTWNSDGHAVYQVWTDTQDRSAPFAAMLGTMLQLSPDGSAERITLRPDGTIDIMTVMPPCD